MERDNIDTPGLGYGLFLAIIILFVVIVTYADSLRPVIKHSDQCMIMGPSEVTFFKPFVSKYKVYTKKPRKKYKTVSLITNSKDKALKECK